MKFSADWLGDHVSVAEAGGPDGVRRLLDRAGLPVEGIETTPDDVLLDVEITPNRPDAMNHRGLAREVAAMAGLPFEPSSKDWKAPAADGPPVAELASIQVDVPRLCRRFGARVIRGIRSVPSPERIRARLVAIGSKPIDAAVDATNYVLWDLGQPLHAFDLDKLRGGRIVVRKARRGEKLVTLDGVERTLEPADVVVADAERAVALAGIMGGLDTAVSERSEKRPPGGGVVGPRRGPAHVAPARNAHRRIPPVRTRRGPGGDPGSSRPGGGASHRGRGWDTGAGLLDVRGKAFVRRRAVLRLVRLRLLSGDSRLDLDFAAAALARLGFGIGTKSAKR